MPSIRSIPNEVARRALSAAIQVRGAEMVPWPLVSLLGRVAYSRDTLAYWFRRQGKGGIRIRNKRVEAVLRDYDLEAGTVGADGLNFLESVVFKQRPHAILELGSGASTVLFAAVMAELYGESGPSRVFSIDQSETYAESTRRLLDNGGLASVAMVRAAPLTEQLVLGRRSSCYTLSHDLLDDLAEMRPDFLLIDGPSGGGDVRLGTLPLVASRLARPCTFFLDDAFRDDEIGVVSNWRRLPGVELRGVHARGNGLLEGRLIGPQPEASTPGQDHTDT